MEPIFNCFTNTDFHIKNNNKVILKGTNKFEENTTPKG